MSQDKNILIFLNFVFLYMLLNFVPYSWFVNMQSFEAVGDVCVGSDVVRFHSDRTTLFGIGIEGSSWSQIVKVLNDEIIETTITRGSLNNQSSWAYEPETTSATYDTTWSSPFTQPGVYGANEWLTIYPLPFIRINTFRSGLDATFNVVECDI